MASAGPGSPRSATGLRCAWSSSPFLA